MTLDITLHISMREEPVAAWSVVDGFVVVDGKRVRGAYRSTGVQLPNPLDSRYTCQRCYERYPWPTSLIKRFEPALDREMYWFGWTSSPPRRCPDCVTKHAVPKED